MKIFLLHLLVFLGISKAYSGTSEAFKEIVPTNEAAESAAGGCSGCKECGGVHG